MVSAGEEGLKRFLAEAKRRASLYVSGGPYVLNPQADVVESVLVGLARNRLRHGRFYCPCREVTGDASKDRANICPCLSHREEIARGGSCECGLFMSPEFAAQQKR